MIAIKFSCCNLLFSLLFCSLLAIGLEEFTEFIKSNNPKHKAGCLRWAMTYVVEYLLVGRNANILNMYVRKKRSQKGNPLEVSLQSASLLADNLLFNMAMIKFLMAHILA